MRLVAGDVLGRALALGGVLRGLGTGALLLGPLFGRRHGCSVAEPDGGVLRIRRRNTAAGTIRSRSLCHPSTVAG